MGYAANVIVKDTGRIAWRLQLGSACIPAIPILCGIFFCPESPRWLMKKNRYPEAFASFSKLRLAPIIAARDLYYSHVLYEEERKLGRGVSYVARFRELFTVPRIRRASWASAMVMIAQQMCGINSEYTLMHAETWLTTKSFPSTRRPCLSMVVLMQPKRCMLLLDSVH